MKDKLKESAAFLAGRQRAYQRAFSDDNDFTKAVLDDLRKFCRAEATTFHPDERMSQILEGRREVWLRLQDHLKLSFDELWRKYNARGAE